MTKKEIGNWVSSRQVEAESVERVIYTLTKYFPFCGYDETDHNDEEDKIGIDIVFFPDEKFTDLTGFPTINVQVKSSETGLNGFFNQGKKINGAEGYEWRQKRLVVLDAHWHEESLIADFVAQVGNLMGIYFSPEMSQFVNQLDPYVQQCFRRTVIKGILTEYNREEMYAWVSG
jgi:hypothetical protein